MSTDPANTNPAGTDPHAAHAAWLMQTIAKRVPRDGRGPLSAAGKRG